MMQYHLPSHYHLTQILNRLFMRNVSETTRRSGGTVKYRVITRPF